MTFRIIIFVYYTFPRNAAYKLFCRRVNRKKVLNYLAFKLFIDQSGTYTEGNKIKKVPQDILYKMRPLFTGKVIKFIIIFNQ